MWAYKHSRETARRMPCYRGEFKPNHPEFAQGSDAYIKDVEMGPVPIDAPPIVYTEEDNEAIRTAIKKFGRLHSQTEIYMNAVVSIDHLIPSIRLLAHHGIGRDEA